PQRAQGEQEQPDEWIGGKGCDPGEPEAAHTREYDAEEDQQHHRRRHGRRPGPGGAHHRIVLTAVHQPRRHTVTACSRPEVGSPSPYEASIAAASSMRMGMAVVTACIPRVLAISITSRISS